MSTAITVVPKQRVEFVDWDSDKELERHLKGVSFRKILKNRHVEKKIALQADENEGAERAWNVLVDEDNQGPISNFASSQDRGARTFVINLQDLFHHFRRSHLWAQIAPPRPNYRARDMLHYMRQANATFADIQAADDVQGSLVVALDAISGLRYFNARFISPPAISPTSSEDAQKDREERPRRRPRDDDANAPPARRLRSARRQNDAGAAPQDEEE